MKRKWLMCAAMLMASPLMAAENLAQDPGFEAEGQAEWLSYNFGPQFGIEWNATDQKHGGKHSLKLTTTPNMSMMPSASQTMQIGNSNKWEMSGAKQVYAVQPGDIISGGAWLMYQNLQKVEVFLECKWLDAAQKELGGGIGTVHKMAGSAKWEYQNLEMWSPLERTAPEGASFVDLRLTFLAAGTSDIATGTAWWDDVQFTIKKK
jgi:hypothetical protein